MLDALSVLQTYDTAVLAVSGGSDSTALMHLAAHWRRAGAGGRPRFVVATVDHGLRAGSDVEAAGVGRAAAALGLEHHVLTLAEKPGGAFSQAWARAARYRALIALARSCGGGRVAIVTAHTRDDQAETVLMRLGRGSGVDGLGGMRPVVTLLDDDGGRIDLVRPLLDAAKADLAVWLTNKGVTWFEDPSNEQVRFERVRLRGQRDARVALGLEDAALARSARRARRASAALDTALFRAMREAGPSLVLSRLGHAEIDRGWFAGLEEELRLRLMGRLLAATGGQVGPVSLGRLEDRLAALETGGQPGFTLAGAQVESVGARMFVYREPQDGRSPMAQMQPDPDSASLWDNRFIVTPVPGVPAAEVTVGALGPEGLKQMHGANVAFQGLARARIFWGHPVLRHLNVVRWAPGLDWRMEGAGPPPFDLTPDWSRVWSTVYAPFAPHFPGA